MDLYTALKTMPFLAELDDNTINKLAATFHIEEIDNGHVLIKEGARGDSIFLVLDGEIVVTNESSGSKQELHRMVPGDLFGLLALIDNEPRAATCTASGPARVARMSREDYMDLVNRNVSVSLAFQRAVGAQLARDFRNIAQKVRDLLEDSTTGGKKANRDFDVVVGGGGPIGLIYATWVKHFRPESSVAVIERRDKPGHKVGESTLATTTRCMRAMGLSKPILRRLFANKAGLRFFYTDQQTDKLQSHFDIVDIEETYQVERRVLETALQETTRREGVQIFTGTRIHIKQSNFEGEMNEIACEGPENEIFTLRCKIFCDASGSASVLPRHLGLYRKDMEMYNTFNCSSYFGYFKPKKDVPVDHWDYPATRHICFPDGWLWFITLNSWESTPDDKLFGMIKELLDHPAGPDETYPSREKLAKRFGCTNEPVISVGFTIREDRDDTAGLPIEKRFDHYVNKYPAIRWVMDHYELLEGYYTNKQRAYSAFMKMAHDCEKVTGDGWCVIGDAAMFTNPLFSHGLNFGTGTAYMAAQDTVRALNTGYLTRQSFATYEKYAHDIFRQNINETDMLHRAFKHVDSFERTLALKVYFAASDVLARDDYSETDPFVFDLLNPEWVEQVNKVIEVERRGERDAIPPEKVARQIHELVDTFSKPILESQQVKSLELGRYMNNYNNDGLRVENKKEKPRGDYKAILCTCGLYYDDSLKACPYCGTKP